MLIVDNVYVSEDIIDHYFVCDLIKCRGACCVEGDLGAPLEESELAILDQIYEKVKPYLTLGGQHEIASSGKYIKDYEGDFSTPTIDHRECAYAFYDEKGILKCGIEQAYLEGKINFKKPISCHLYPIRITKYDFYEAVNYHHWKICNPACSNGEKLKIPLYEFLKEPLIRKYGEVWYQKLLEEIKNKSKIQAEK